MPIYEYQCSKCNHSLEALQKMSDPPLRKCPECGKQGLEKLVSAASFRLKGGGWYETDFKTGDKKQLADSDSSPASKSEGQSDTASTAKPAAEKSDAKSKPAASDGSGAAGKGKSKPAKVKN